MLMDLMSVNISSFVRLGFLCNEGFILLDIGKCESNFLGEQQI